MTATLALSEPTTSLEDILRLAARGWKIHPCRARDKFPHLKSWHVKATCIPSTIEGWSIAYRDCNWGVKTGADSGIWVLDRDGEKGMNSLNELTGRYGDLWLQTLTAITSNGQHYYFRYPVGCMIRNSASKLRAGLDVRGEGGYVIAPPSFHSSGRQYRWLDPDTAVLPAPEWLLQLLVSPAPKQPDADTVGKLYVGQRNDGLTRLGGASRKRGMELEEILNVLLLANTRRCVPPLDVAEVSTIAASVCRYPKGGPDPLERAWQAIGGTVYKSKYDHFVALFNQLQIQRPGKEIALPLERIAALFECDRSLIGHFRRKAVSDGKLELIDRYVVRRRAATFRVVGIPPSISPSSGLEGMISEYPSGNVIEGEL
jgi:hypothetical protein